ncbi:MAG TPA: CxxC-x17-CxxC domain-containing protein [Alphaproteobacteria bacterium]|nr:CxxC-x17-CxxC domain-containing protein [Alphaproteobacteria bacterium]
MAKFSGGGGNRFGKRGSARSEARERGRDHKERMDSGKPPAFKSKIKDSGFELFETECAKCGKNCDVPFLPKNNKPVYCRSCFRGTTPEESGRGPSRDRDSRGRDRFDSREERPFRSSGPSQADIDDINRKLDKIMKALKIN